MSALEKINLAMFVLLLVASVTSGSASGSGKHLGSAGQTFEIAEPDALLEIETRAAEVDWESVIDKEEAMRRVREYRPADLWALPPAARDRVFLADMTYTLDMDIPDGRGAILYPKGYSFNPLDYVPLTSILVILDGGDRRQTEWFTASQFAADFRTKLIITAGASLELAEALDRPVFYLPAEMAGRLRLAAVPSVVRQKGRHLEVQEIHVERE